LPATSGFLAALEFGLTTTVLVGEGDNSLPPRRFQRLVFSASSLPTKLTVP